MRTVYSTNNAMQMREAGTPLSDPTNSYGCGIAIGASDKNPGEYSLNVANPNPDAPAIGTFVMLDRVELTAIRDAINVELARVN